MSHFSPSDALFYLGRITTLLLDLPRRGRHSFALLKMQPPSRVQQSPQLVELIEDVVIDYNHRDTQIVHKRDRGTSNTLV